MDGKGVPPAYVGRSGTAEQLLTAKGVNPFRVDQAVEI